jgi:serine/threonine protein kinase/tetratricopeptide (TPR) repeat protein
MSLWCPVCALRNGLASNEDEFVAGDPCFAAGRRFEHFELVVRDDQTPLELGRGAMGVTYKAIDLNLHCPVALKVINSRYLGDESVRRLFLTEARAAAGLRHPNVASVFHLGTAEGDYFYAMEFVDGESLDRVLKSRGPLEVSLALEILHQVTGALGAGYRQGLVHRDIKPANLMAAFDEEGEVTVKVIDYGLVRRAQAPGSGKPEAERFIGTPQFASPEQCAGKEADIRADLYSLGVTLWVMLLGKVPFEGRFSEILEKQQFEPPPFEKLERVPAPVVSLLQSLLEKDPRNRPQTPLELRAKVREIRNALATENDTGYRPERPRSRDNRQVESPYRGLKVFDVQNESIFFGRTKERDEVLGALQNRSSEENRPFVLIFGPSGSGKSSLLRAGVMPWLCRPGVIEGVDLWRSVLYRPADYPGDLLEGLAEALLSSGGLPEIRFDGTDSDRPAALFSKSPEDFAALVKEALSRVAREEQDRRNLPIPPITRLALGLDQLEEIFTLAEKFSRESRLSFFRTVRALTEGGYCWVVATLRSDFFSRCEELNDLMQLKQGNGQYHLLPPTAVQLSQIIRYPAEATGVKFEEHPDKGRLDERIRDDALKEPGGLPLLEYALDELFRSRKKRDPGSGDILRHADYEALGGVEGALRKRADDAFSQLGPWERDALGQVLHQLARLGSADEETLTRRVARYETAAAQPGAKGLVDSFITARLLIADRDSNGVRTLTVAHEALFRVWPEISRWEKANRDFLRTRARLGEALTRWKDCNQQSDYLLVPGRPLAEAEDLLKNHQSSLDQEEINYIRISRAQVARGVRRRWLLVAAVIVLLVGVAGAAIWEWGAALRNENRAVESENRAVAARGSAEGILNYLLNQLSDKLRPIGHLDIIEDVQKQVETYYKNLGFNQEDPGALNNWATLLKAEGDRLRAQGDLNEARSKYQQSLELAEKLAHPAPTDTTRQRSLEASYNAVGVILSDQGDWNGAKEKYEAANEIAQRLIKQDPNNTLEQRDLLVTYNRLGNVFFAQGDLSRAKARYQDLLEIARKLTSQDPSNRLWQRDLEVGFNKLGDVLISQGDMNGARIQFERGLEIALRLAGLDPSNSDAERDLEFTYVRLGDVLKEQGDLAAAAADYQSGLEVIQKLAKQDPANSGWQADLSDNYRKMGDVLMKQGDLAGANAQFENGLEILEKLVKQDSTNGYWQKDLSASYQKLGEVLKARGDLQGAHQKFQLSRDILLRLIQIHGETPTWKADLELINQELAG